ncbi:hypothetical protein BJX99DRAFT_226268 [Aspergillus californicus]
MDGQTEFGRPRTIYSESSVSNSKSTIRVPDIPKVAEGQAEFNCPFCGQTLMSEGLSRLQWKRHVFRDLRPYVCTFTECQNAEKLYATRHEWLYHEMQMHRRKCTDANGSVKKNVVRNSGVELKWQLICQSVAGDL